MSFASDLQKIVNKVMGLKQYVLGSTDGSAIGNVGDRLKVDANFTSGAGTIPAGKVLHTSNFLLNGSASAMNVNGSSTPQVFSWTVPANETWYIPGISMFMLDVGTMDPTDFGSISSSLTNGLLIETVIDGTTYTVGNYTNNRELALLFSAGAANGNNTGLFGTSGFLENSDIYLGSKIFQPNATLNAGDVIKVTVRDNLTALDTLLMSITRWRLLP